MGLRRKAWLRRGAMFALSVLVAVLVVRVIGAIDWAAVRGALTKLTWWQPIVLLAVATGGRRRSRAATSCRSGTASC